MLYVVRHLKPGSIVRPFQINPSFICGLNLVLFRNQHENVNDAHVRILLHHLLHETYLLATFKPYPSQKLEILSFHLLSCSIHASTFPSSQYSCLS